MRKDLYYNAAGDEWSCVVDRLLTAEECKATGEAALKKQREALAREQDPGRCEVIKRSIAAIVEGRVIQMVGAASPAPVGR